MERLTSILATGRKVLRGNLDTVIIADDGLGPRIDELERLSSGDGVGSGLELPQGNDGIGEFVLGGRVPETHETNALVHGGRHRSSIDRHFGEYQIECVLEQGMSVVGLYDSEGDNLNDG